MACSKETELMKRAAARCNIKLKAARDHFLYRFLPKAFKDAI